AGPGIDEPLDESAIRREHVDESVACPGLIVVTTGGLQGKADVELTVQDSQVEWRPVLPRRSPGGDGRKVRIRDVFDEAEARVVHLDGSGVEVGRVEEGAPGNRRDGQALVDGAAARIVHPFERLGRIDGTASPRNCAVFGDKDEIGAPGRDAVRHDECRRVTVEHLPGRGCGARCLAGRREDRDRARGRHLHAGRRIERGDSGAVVRYPEGTCWSERDPPWIDQIGIDVRCRGEAQAREKGLVISNETRELKGPAMGRCDHAKESARGEKGSDESGSHGGGNDGATGIPAHVMCLLTTSVSLSKSRHVFGYRTTEAPPRTTSARRACSQTGTVLVERDVERPMATRSHLMI